MSDDERYITKDQRPLVQNCRAFLKAQPLICDKCGKFTDTYREYCEGCGAKYSLRKANKKDFNYYVKKKGKTNEFKNKPLEPEILDVEPFLKGHPFICVYCWEFSIKNRGYCEKCGTNSSLRRAKKKYLTIYEDKREKYLRNEAMKRKFISKPLGDISPSEFLEIKNTPSSSDNWKKKIEEDHTLQPEKINTVSEMAQKELYEKSISAQSNINTEKLHPTTSTSFKGEEEIKLNTKAQKQITPPILEVSKANSINVFPDNKEEKLKEYPQFCKFCGMKLDQLEKFCKQCGIIIKRN